MTLSLQTWHERFQKQARWTQPLRSYLYNLAKIEQAQRVMEIGCGSGAILGELSQFTEAVIYGLDIDANYLDMAMRNTQDALLLQADAHYLPLAPSSFDLVLCHFLLLWVNDPDRVLKEMARITHPGGYVCALAEPDYGARINSRIALPILVKTGPRALRSQGANPEIGRQLRGLLTNAGLVEVVSGVLGGQWKLPFDHEEWESEWEVLEADLANFPDFQALKDELKAQDQHAWTSGERILFVPTFYAWGKVPG